MNYFKIGSVGENEDFLAEKGVGGGVGGDGVGFKVAHSWFA